MYVIKATLHPNPEGKLRRAMSGYLKEGRLFGGTYWLMTDSNKSAHTFTSKKAALAAAREWRDGDKYRSFEIVTS